MIVTHFQGPGGNFYCDGTRHLRERPGKDPMQLVPAGNCDKVSCSTGKSTVDTDKYDRLNALAIEQAFGVTEEVPRGKILVSPWIAGLPVVFPGGIAVEPGYLRQGRLLENNEEVLAIVRNNPQVWRNSNGNVLVRKPTERYGPADADRSEEARRTIAWLKSVGVAEPEVLARQSRPEYARAAVYWYTLASEKLSLSSLHLVVMGAIGLLSRTGKQKIDNVYVRVAIEGLQLPLPAEHGLRNHDYLRFLRGVLRVVENPGPVIVEVLK